MSGATDDRWPAALIALHWLAGLLALATAGYGLYLASPPEWSQFYIDRYMAGAPYHKLGGLIVLALAVIWLVVRTRAGRPGMNPGPVPSFIVQLVHGALLGLLIALPATGYLMDAFSGPTRLPGGWTLPAIFHRNDALGMLLARIHGPLAYGLLALAGFHFVGALWHAFRQGDRTLRAILPGRSSRQGAPGHHASP